MRRLTRFAPTSATHMKRLLVLLSLLVIVDGVVTEFLVKNGFGREGNPVLVDLVGTKVFLILKVVGALLCALVLWDIYKKWPKLAVISTSCLALGYSAIVLWNLSIPFIFPQ